VLMADDDAEDCMLATLAVAESGAKAAFSTVQDGIELMDYLSEHSRSKEKRLPDLILLDMNKPRKDGHHPNRGHILNCELSPEMCGGKGKLG